MNKKGFLVIALLIIALLVPFIVFRASATLTIASLPSQVYAGRTTSLNGSTTDNVTDITRVIWDFGDNTTIVNGTSSALLNTAHVYAAAGVYNATLTVTFGGATNKTDIASALVTVVQNVAPVANAGPDQVLEQTSYAGANVNLDGTGSSDQYNDPLSYSWVWTGGSATGATPTALFPPGSTTVTLTVSDGEFNATDTVNILVQDTIPPVANAGTDVEAEQESHAGTQVMLNGTATDVGSERFNFTWSEGGVVLGTATNVTDTMLTYTFNLGIHVVTLDAVDQAGNMGSDNVTVTIVDTIPPVVDAGQDLTVEQESHAGTEVTLTGTATDICSERFNFTWSEGGVVLGTATNVTDTMLTYTFNLGTHTVTLTATDQAGNTASDDVIVNVIDTTPPEINVTATPNMLWPPNHKYVEVTVDVSVYDICDPNPTITFVSATSNEPDNSIGDGNTVNDIVKTGAFTFDIRAERSGPGSDRVYTIMYKATDVSGNYAIGTVTIVVPHNK